MHNLFIDYYDDAQGYGFKTAQKAYASYGYKSNLNGRKPANKAVIKAWIKKDPKHAKFIKHLDKVISNGFYPDDDLTDYEFKKYIKDTIEKVISETDFEIPFNVSELKTFLGYK